MRNHPRCPIRELADQYFFARREREGQRKEREREGGEGVREREKQGGELCERLYTDVDSIECE